MNMNDGGYSRLDLAAVRAKLASLDGPEYWRGLDELAETPEFKEFLEREFPRQASVWDGGGVSRRSFLKLMAASLALAGLSSCSKQPDEKIVPYVKSPEGLVPGTPLWFATAMTLGGYARGILVRSNEGRPTKIEGNPLHPDSLGAADVFMQASILSVYDPDRSQVVIHRGSIGTWDRFWDTLQTELGQEHTTGGAGLRILTDVTTSPTFIQQMRSLLTSYPRARWSQYDPVGKENGREGTRLAFGERLDVLYDFSSADIVLSLDADFLATEPGSLRYTRQFSDRRRVRGEKADMNRLYVVESAVSITGATADHRLPLRPGQIEGFARAIARELGLPGLAASPSIVDDTRSVKWVEAVADDLKANRGRSIIVAGEQQPPIVHALAHAMNHSLANVGRTLKYIEAVETRLGEQSESLPELVEEMEAGKVNRLIIVGANPVYDAPSDLNFTRALEKVPLRIRLGVYYDETSALCHWHVPESHYLESWSDARASDGTASIIQPLIAPLYNTLSRHEFFNRMMGTTVLKGYEIIRQHWRNQRSDGSDFDSFWTRALNDGVVAETASPFRPVALKFSDRPTTQQDAGGIDIVFRPDPCVWDGRFSNNGWLQELPKPVTKITWDNVALISAATAERLGVTNEDVVELAHHGQRVNAPVWVMPGQPDDVVAVELGYGRWRAGRVGTNLGFNAYRLRTTGTPWFGSGLEVHKTGGRYALSTTQTHHRMEGRHPVRVATLQEYLENPDFPNDIIHPPQPDHTLYPKWEYDGFAWGMSIDLNACTGCNACVIACQAENNIPIVGKEQVKNSREMHWIRLDSYYHGDLENPEIVFQPVGCVHCENAPCEVVCPVNATVHDHEGLNVMVYNRCVGTRYCSNNCPYKVRRFNFLEYNEDLAAVEKMQKNPDVTVRSRGVMEKCTYCVQRISHARIEAKKENRSILDGEVMPACAQSCPAQAIVFGDINDHTTEVYRWKQEPRTYGLLAELNTRPRTTYLARLRNPNPVLEKENSS